jgi:hypothetical protein
MTQKIFRKRKLAELVGIAKKQAAFAREAACG